MKKIDLNNTVIEVLDREHGKRVKEFFLSQFKNNTDEWESINMLKFTENKEKGYMNRFYGFLNGFFKNYRLNLIQEHESKHSISITIARLEDFEPKFPREMYVWTSSYNVKDAVKMIVYGIDQYSENGILYIGRNNNFDNAMEIDEWEEKFLPKPKVEEMTLDDALSEALGRKVKIKVP